MEITPEIQAEIDAAVAKAKAESFKGFEDVKSKLALAEEEGRKRAEEKQAAEAALAEAKLAVVKAEVKRLALSKGLVSERLLAHPDFSFDASATEATITAHLDALRLAEPAWFTAQKTTIGAVAPVVPGTPSHAVTAPAVPADMVLPGDVDFRQCLQSDGTFDTGIYAEMLQKKGLSFIDTIAKIPNRPTGLFS